MKKRVLLMFMVGMSLVGKAQNQVKSDSLVQADLTEGAASIAKGDLYTATARYQQALALAKEANLSEYTLSAYTGLVQVSEKTFNYVKALEYERLSSHLRDSIQQQKYNTGQEKKDSSFKHQLQTFSAQQAKDREEIAALKQQQIGLGQKGEEMRMYALLGLALGIVLLALVCFLLFRLSSLKKRTRSDRPVIENKEAQSTPSEQQKSNSTKVKLQEELPGVSTSSEIQAVAVVPPIPPNAISASDIDLTEFFPESFVPPLPQAGFIRCDRAKTGAVVLFLGSSADPSGSETGQLLDTRWKTLVESDRSIHADTALSELHPTATEGLYPGMFCIFDLKGGWLRFAARQAALWLIRKGELREFVAASASPATVQTLGLRKGDCLYFVSTQSSDSKDLDSLKDLLIALHALPAQEQLQLIRNSPASSPNRVHAGIRL
jgi:hypothetical protein